MATSKSKIPAWVWVAIAAVGTGIGVTIVLLVRKSIRKGAEQRRLRNYGNKSIEGQIGGIPYVMNLGTVAQAINDSFYNNDWFGMTEDEERAITELSNVPDALIPELVKVYYNLYKRDLKGDFVKFVDADQFDSVKNKFF